MSSVNAPCFPSQKTIDRIEKLKKVDATPTQFQGMSPDQIAREIVTNLGGSITIDLSKAPESERAPIRNAASIDIDGQKPDITILGDNGDGTDEQDSILRAINAEILDDSPDNEVNIGRIAFRRFIQALLKRPELIKEEWNSFIVGHAKTGQIETPYESHHFSNVGLKLRSEGEDVLREQQIGFIKGVMEEFRERLRALFENNDMKPHAKAGMNTLDVKLLAIGEAEWSNFVRGAGYYRYRRGEGSLDEYAPRRLAANIIDQVIAEQSPEIQTKWQRFCQRFFGWLRPKKAGC